ncbi:MAG: hypothetical protein NTY19_26605 [Planctomycetota bacterium]|nr:hypothetical protein [Planctomycetota bacterium]
MRRQRFTMVLLMLACCSVLLATKNAQGGLCKGATGGGGELIPFLWRAKTMGSDVQISVFAAQRRCRWESPPPQKLKSVRLTPAPGFAEFCAARAPDESTIRIRSLDSATPILRAQRPATIEAVIENAGPTAVNVAPKLLLPAGVRAVREPPAVVRIGSGDEATLAWTITADSPLRGDLTLQVQAGSDLAATRSLAVQILEPVAVHTLPYIPPPEAVKTPI